MELPEPQAPLQSRTSRGTEAGRGFQGLRCRVRAQGAKYIAALLESLGAEIKMAHGPRDDSNPVVLGRIGRDPSRPTILFYGAPPPAPPPSSAVRPTRPRTLGPG